MFDEFFTIRALTRAINKLKPAPRKVLDKLFKRSRGELTDDFAIDVVSGTETLLPNLGVSDPATVGGTTERKGMKVTAPRLAEKRFIPAKWFNGLRAFSKAVAVEKVKERLNLELTDMRNKIDRTREHYAAGCLSGKILDSDGSVLVDWLLPATHKITLGAGSKWSEEGGDFMTDLRTWKRLIEDDAANPIIAWFAFCGWQAMDALIPKAKDYMLYVAGDQLAKEGRIAKLAEVDIIEYNGSYIDANGTRQRYVAPDHFMLVGLTEQDFEELYAPVVDLDAPGGVGSGGIPQLFFAKTKQQWDPSGIWVKTESRPLTMVYDANCFVDADVV